MRQSQAPGSLRGDRIPAGFKNCGDTLSFTPALLGGFAPYLNVTLDKYSNESAWAAAAIARLQRLQFNMISGWSATVAEVAAASAGLYYSHLLDFGVTWPYAWSKGLDWDVWSSNFTSQVATIAAREVAPRASDPFLMFWQSDNEVNWGAVGLACYLSFPAAQPGNGAVLAWLQKRYGNSIAALNAAWNITATSFADVVNHLQAPGLNKAAFNADDADFQGVVAQQYFAVCNSAIRQYDTNHLFSGVRLAVSSPQIIAAAAPYVDLFDQHSCEVVRARKRRAMTP